MAHAISEDSNQTVQMHTDLSLRWSHGFVVRWLNLCEIMFFFRLIFYIHVYILSTSGMFRNKTPIA